MEQCPEDQPHKRSHKKDLQAQSCLETLESQLDPVAEPVADAVMYQGSKECDSRDNQADRKGLNGQDDKNRFVPAGSEEAERQFLCSFGDQKKDQAEHNDVFQPHFLDCHEKYLWSQTAHVEADGIACHAEYHAENHDKRKNDALKFCFWHN